MLFGVFLVIVLALALTPTIASSVTDGKYIQVTEIKTITPSSSNATTLTNEARNDSDTYAYFHITLNNTDAYGLTAVHVASNITYTETTKSLAFKVGVLNSSIVYNATITYYYVAMSTAAQSLIGIVPIIWVVVVLAVGISAIYIILRKQS